MATLPRGIVTFLFTDIEGSTRLWERDAEVMWTALARHNAILDDVIVRNRGVHFKTIGDAFQAAFANPADALRAAVDAQRQLTLEPWKDTGPLRVRMALHLGPAKPLHGDYLAPCLNRLSRLLSTGYGAQVLVSRAVQQEVHDHLPESTTLRDLGSHRLRDLLEPERVYQVVIAGLPADFPPLKSLERHPTNLPIQPNPLVGRETELIAIRDLLEREDVRLTTLTGAGGTGKTRLALQVAAEMLDAFEDGAFFVDLAPLTDSDLVMSTIASTLGIRETGGLSLREALLTYLADKRALLVLDNFEHVVNAAPVVADLLATCAQLKVLVTSRTPLRIRGEFEYPVQPLELPDARNTPPLDRLASIGSVELFVQRATAVRPDFALTPANAVTVAEICVRLDGLPLAIELAAARVKFLEPVALLERLARRLQILTGGSRDLPSRQQTLRATITWSYDLLSASEQALFRRLAVFAGSGSVEAATVVGNAAGRLPLDVLDGVMSLVDQSLARRAPSHEGEPRFSMLETLREFGLERLDEQDEGEPTRRAYAAWCVNLSETAEPHLTGPEQGTWLERLETEHDNLRAALEWAMGSDANDTSLRLAGSLWRFWYMHGHVQEGRIWLERALADGDARATASRSKTAQGAGTLAYLQGDYAQARVFFEEELTLARALGDELNIAVSLNNLGGVAREQGNNASATALFEESLAIARKAGHQAGVAAALANLGNIAWDLRDYPRAAALYEQSLAQARAMGDQHGVAVSLNNLGGVAHRQGDLMRAAAIYEECLALFRAMGQRVGVAISLLNLGNVTREQGDMPRAARLYGESLALAQAIGDKESIVEGLQGAAGMAAARGDAIAAGRLIGAADALREAIGAARPADDTSGLARLREDVQEQLGSTGFEVAWMAGQGLTMEQAVAEAQRLLHTGQAQADVPDPHGEPN